MKDSRRVVLSIDERHRLISEMIHNTPDQSYWPDSVMNNANRALDLKAPVVRFRGYLPSKRQEQHRRVLHAWVTMSELSDAQIHGLHSVTRGIKGRRSSYKKSDGVRCLR